MYRYIVRRLLFSVPALLVVTILAFVLIRLAPGDVIDTLLAQSGGVTTVQRQQMRHDLGLDRNPAQQYLVWLGNAARGDLGRSLVNGRSISSQLAQPLTVTLELAALALALSLVIAIPIGIVAAVHRNSPLDEGLRLFSVLGLSLPDFWIATLVIIFLAREFHWLPPPYASFADHPWLNIQTLIFPAVIVGYRLSAFTARMTRSSMLEVLSQDYVRTARAKGLRERTVILGHTLKNAMIPILSVAGSQVVYLLGGLVLMEVIFDLPGLGSMAYQAVTTRDYTIIQADILLFAIMILVTNIFTDLLYAVLDPRIQYS